jgi:hypothetical protein
MEPWDAKRLRVVEDENGKLKKLLAESAQKTEWVVHSNLDEASVMAIKGGIDAKYPDDYKA